MKSSAVSGQSLVLHAFLVTNRLKSFLVRRTQDILDAY